MKIIIAGSRGFNNYELLKKFCDFLLKDKDDVTIISGCAMGADMLGAEYAFNNGYKLEACPAEWKTYGKSAGYKRNIKMSEIADSLIAFWDGKSKGTKHMIDTMKKLNKPCKVIKYEQE